MTKQNDMGQRTRLKIVKTDSKSPWAGLLAVITALVAGLSVGAAAIAISGISVTKAYGALFNGAFGSANAVLQTILQATPLLFTGLAAVVAFRGKIWNIGGEGQFLMGAMMASWVSMTLADLPQIMMIPIIILVSMVGGAFWAGIAGYLRARFKVNEIIVTVMLNYVVTYILSYLLQNNWADPDTAYIHSIRFAPSTYFPSLFGTRLHIGVILGVVMAILVYLLVWKTPLGFEIRSIGVNPVAAQYKGIHVTRTILITMLISGALAGLGGGTEIAGIHHRLRMDISTGYGFTGILVAMTGQLHPFGAIIAAIFFGALVNGSYLMQISSRVPVALVNTIQGVILFFLVMAFVLSQYRIKKVKIDE
jgi:general nucleoside transport system permease protein